MNLDQKHPKVAIITGGAGFVAANLIQPLLVENATIFLIDDLSRGSLNNFKAFVDHPMVHFCQADLSDRSQCRQAFVKAAQLGKFCEVWHMAANSDIPAGVADSDVDFKKTFCTTYEILRAMQEFSVDTIHFASSSAVYGDLGEQALHEAIGPLLPISNYGAMKLASEAQLSAAAEKFLRRVNIFRFPNVVGIPATHGVIYDFVNKLRSNPTHLEVLGDGTQQKAYLHVSDLVDAMLLIRQREIEGKVEVVNIGPADDGVTVRSIAEQVVARVNPVAEIQFGEGNRGWVGDVPKFNYSTDKLQSFGWKPRLGSKMAIRRAIDEIATSLGV